MASVKLYVSLKIPDTTEITAFQTLKRMGYDMLSSLKRRDYYEFEVTRDTEEFKEKIKKTDILVNANKHKPEFEIQNIDEEGIFKINVIVTNSLDSGESLIKQLEGLGFSGIEKSVSGVLWTLGLKSSDMNSAKNIAEKITKDLLMNENYQDFSMF